MLKTFTLIALISSILFLDSCSHKNEVRQEKSVVVSILPQKYLIDKISGGIIRCEVMIPPGGNHETFEPSPRDMERVMKASAYFAIGALDFEKAWIEKIQAVKPGLEIINTSKGIDMIKGHSHGGADNQTTDPHIWLSPDAVKIQAGQIYKSLCRIFPADSVNFRTNLTGFIHEADSADTYITHILSPYKGRTFLIYHPAFAYFARYYSLNQASIENEGKEPSPVHMREIIDMAKANSIRAIFVSKEFDTRHAETIARQLGAKLIIFDPMAYKWTENIMQIARLMAESMEYEPGAQGEKH